MSLPMNLLYPASFEPQPGVGFSVLFPDVPEAITEGEDLAAAKDVASSLNLGAAAVGGAGYCERRHRIAAPEFHLVDLAVAPDPQPQPIGQRVDHRYPDTVEAPRYLVAVVVELAAGMENGQHHFSRGLAAGVAIHGNAAAVVDHRDRAVDVNRDVDLVAEASQRLVDRVVDDFEDEVMEAADGRVADVHRRPLADVLDYDAEDAAIASVS